MNIAMIDGQILPAVEDEDEARFGTVGELRRLIEGVPDGVRVTICQIPDPLLVSSLCVLSSLNGSDLRPDTIPVDSRHQVTALCLCEVS